MEMWIIALDSYPHCPLQARSSTRSVHVVKIGSHAIVGIVM